MPRKKRKPEEEPENLERWLVSYADFITLLFAFFVTMYAISRVDEKKFGSMVESMQRALGSVIVFQTTQREAGVFTNYSKPIDVNLAGASGFKGSSMERENLQQLAREIKQRVDEISGAKGGKGDTGADQLQFFLDKRGLILRFSERVFFDSGEASLRPEIIPVLNAVAKPLEKIHNQIRIEGHTDSVPINTPQFPSNWELSTARATTIVRFFLTRFSFNPNRLSAAGYGEYRPIASNSSPDGRQQNRRVDVVILSGKEMEAEPPPPEKENG
jgi:chemotaxis protein MotB